MFRAARLVIGAIAATFLCRLPIALAAGYDIPPPVANALKAAGIPRSAVSLLVLPVDASRPQISVNADKAMNPASVMKLVTTYAALDLLGPAYTWKTEAYGLAPVVDGALTGNLYLKGSGDPKFTLEQFWLLLRQLRARGIREIRGDVMLDNSVFDVHDEDHAPFDDKPLRAYNVRPDGLLLNFKSLRLTLVPNAALGTVNILAEPRLDSLDIVNQLHATGGDCREWKDAIQTVQTAEAGRYRLVLTGNYPAACDEKELNLGVLPHADYIAAVFRDIWRELGGSLTGGIREGPVAINAQLLASIESSSLSEIVRDINKYSNNVMARQLYLTLGRDVTHRPARPADAEAVIRAWLAVKGLDFPELVLENGAGLSRRERISAASLGRLLQTAWASPLMPELVASLPLAAVDGTLQKRLKGQSVSGQAHIKTGTLDDVKTLAGYVRDKKGQYRIVAFLVNHPRAEAAQAAQDALLEWVYERSN